MSFDSETVPESSAKPVTTERCMSSYSPSYPVRMTATTYYLSNRTERRHQSGIRSQTKGPVINLSKTGILYGQNKNSQEIHHYLGVVDSNKKKQNKGMEMNKSSDFIIEKSPNIPVRLTKSNKKIIQQNYTTKKQVIDSIN